jgi:hypothetical protein
MKKIKTYNISKNTTFDLSQLNKDLPDGIYTIKTQAVSVNGKKSPESAGITYKVDSLNPLGLPPFTIRCKFSTGYTPAPQGQSTGWDSQVCVDETNNIWDITKESTSWSRMLEYQDNLIEVLGANTTGVERMYATLNICKNLTKTTLFDTSSVIDMAYMYNEGNSLIECPIYDTSNVTTMRSMFCYCWNLKTVPLFDTSKVEDVARMFDSCDKVESGAYAFYKQVSRQKNPPSNYDRAFYLCGSDTESGRKELEKIPSDWGGEATPIYPRNIWIDFKFLEPDFNPQDAQLAVGIEESNGQNRGFKADWQLVDKDENIWRWGVTEGTDLSSAFRYGGGEQSFPLIVDKNYRDIPEEMWRQEGYSSLEAILADCDKWWTDEIAKDHVNFTGSVEVVDWDLTNATSLDHLFGGNPYWRCAIVGTLPELNSNARHAVYMFGRLYDITSVGKITLPNLNGDIQKLLFAMTSLQDIPVLDLNGNPQNLDMLFWQDCNISKSSIEAAYNYLNTNFGSLGHTNTFKQCGLYKDPTALDNIPASWGGNA